MTESNQATLQPAPEVTEKIMANALRALVMDAVEKAKSGHPGMPLGMADVATVLFARFINIDPSDPSWPDRDRFVLSAGHGSMLQYAIHHLLGYSDMGIEQIKSFRQFWATTAGHPEYGHTAGVETTTGPLGSGLATAVGMALSERMLNARFGDDLVDHYTYVLAGDGCLMEGLSHEAIDLAGHLGLNRLIVLWDDNGISIDGKTELSTSTDQLQRFTAAGWQVQKIDGHNSQAIAEAISVARADRDKPSLIACRTIIGFGAPTRANTAKAHGEPLGEQEIAGARLAYDWPYAPFEIPDTVRAAWCKIVARGHLARESWQQRLKTSPLEEAFKALLVKSDVAQAQAALTQLKHTLIEQKPKIATRKASELALAVINAATLATLGGSADLTHSNLTITKDLRPLSRDDFSGRYVHYGVREHVMGSVMNGVALHGGFIPYGGTFLVFSDYMRGALRLSALMRQQVIYVLTHDSIGLGEDGPTHQPVEHLAMLRATPDLLVMRPADAVETAECWQIALDHHQQPSVLALSRQALPTLRSSDGPENLSGHGAYLLRDVIGSRHITLLASGSEVEIAVHAADLLAAEKINAVVVSMPCWELFEAEDEAYRKAVLGSAPRIGIEAAARLGWDRWIGENGRFIGMTSFGASAPAAALYEHFGLTAQAVAEAARDLISSEDSR